MHLPLVTDMTVLLLEIVDLDVEVLMVSYPPNLETRHEERVGVTESLSEARTDTVSACLDLLASDVFDLGKFCAYEDARNLKRVKQTTSTWDCSATFDARERVKRRVLYEQAQVLWTIAMLYVR